MGENRGAAAERRPAGNDFIPRNPLMATVLGLCPALAVTYRVDNAIVMGVALFGVLLLSRFVLSLISPYLAPKLRFSAELLVASSLATVAALLFRAYLPDMSTRLGIYVPILAVNCLVLGRSKPVLSPDRIVMALKDGVRAGAAFLLSLVAVSLVREVLGSGTITLFPVGNFDGVLTFGGLSRHPAALIGYSTGGLLVLGYLLPLSVWLAGKRGEKRS